MQPKIIRAKDLKENDFKGTKVTNIFNTENYPAFSIAFVKHTSDSRLGLDSESDVAYYILKGKAKWIIEDKEYSAGKGDLIFLPKGTKYKKKTKNLDTLAISSPRFDRNKRIYFE